jgi:hypothetical protein
MSVAYDGVSPDAARLALSPSASGMDLLQRTEKPVPFWTPVTYKLDRDEYDQDVSAVMWLTAKVDSFFCLCGSEAILTERVIDRIADYNDQHEWVVISHGTQLNIDSFSSCTATIFKILAYMTVIIPVIMLVAKLILRLTYDYHFVENVCDPVDIVAVDIPALAEKFGFEPDRKYSCQGLNRTTYQISLEEAFLNVSSRIDTARGLRWDQANYDKGAYLEGSLEWRMLKTFLPQQDAANKRISVVEYVLDILLRAKVITAFEMDNGRNQITFNFALGPKQETA